MKRETIAIHAGYDGDPTTKAVAVPIYQTVAFEFDSAEHGAALFNLEVQGNIYTRIGNPTNTVLEKRMAALEGGVEGLSVSSGMAAIEYALINIAETGNSIVSTPQLYGATYTLLAHIFPKRGIKSRFAASDRPEDVEKLIDENTRAVYCESVGNPAGNVADIEGLARVAHKHGVPLVVDNTVATPILLRPIEYGADVVVHSMTKFIGGGGTSIGGMIVDSGKFPWRQYPENSTCSTCRKLPITAWSMSIITGMRRLSRVAGRYVSEIRVPLCLRLTVFCFCREFRRWLFAWKGMWRTHARSRNFCVRIPWLTG